MLSTLGRAVSIVVLLTACGGPVGRTGDHARWDVVDEHVIRHHQFGHLHHQRKQHHRLGHLHDQPKHLRIGHLHDQLRHVHHQLEYVHDEPVLDHHAAASSGGGT